MHKVKILLDIGKVVTTFTKLSQGRCFLFAFPMCRFVTASYKKCKKGGKGSISHIRNVGPDQTAHCAVWSGPSLSAYRIIEYYRRHRKTVEPDQTARVYRLIYAFAFRIWYKRSFHAMRSDWFALSIQRNIAWLLSRTIEWWVSN